jgi:hypothetical protein
MNPPDAVEECLTVAYIAGKLKLSDDTTRRIFEDEPGVLRIGQGSIGRSIFVVDRVSGRGSQPPARSGVRGFCV